MVVTRTRSLGDLLAFICIRLYDASFIHLCVTALGNMLIGVRVGLEESHVFM